MLVLTTRMLPHTPVSMYSNSFSYAAIIEKLLASVPASLYTLIGRMFALYETPAMPMPLFAVAPMTPDTSVPWPVASSTSAPSRSQPSNESYARSVRRLSTRSGWSRSQPLSSTATVTAPSVRDCVHARSTFALKSQYWLAKL